jgi:hypothetical protein
LPPTRCKPEWDEGEVARGKIPLEFFDSLKKIIRSFPGNIAANNWNRILNATDFILYDSDILLFPFKRTILLLLWRLLLEE